MTALLPPLLPAALLPAAILVPVASALVTLVLPRSRQVILGLIGAILTSLVGLAVVVTVARLGPQEYALAGWSPPLGIALRADGLSAAFVLLASIVGLAVAWVASSEEAATGIRPGFWSLSSLAWAGVVGVFLAGDLFNAYVALEVLGLAAVGLVALGSSGAPAAALRYLLIAVVGSMMLLVAVAMIYAATDTLDIALAGERIAAEHSRIPLVLATAGLALKAALVPMHAWLPPAHAGAPTAVSPLLSALVIKGAFYLVLRLWVDVFPADTAVALGVGVLGAMGVIWGGVIALRQDNLKRIVAYSTVSQIGYLFLALPLLVLPAQVAGGGSQVRASMLAAVVTMVLAHGLAKAALFIIAGSLLLGTGTDHIDGLIGASRTQRILTTAMMLSAVSLVGLPVSLGFAAKWTYALVAIESGTWWIVAVLVTGSLLAAGYLLRPIASVLKDSDESQEVGRVDPDPRPVAQRYAPLALAALAIGGGLLAAPLAALIGIGAP